MSHGTYIYKKTENIAEYNCMELRPSVLQPLKNLPAFYGTQRFIIEFTTVLDWLLS
jgi:hypothetical protein